MIPSCVAPITPLSAEAKQNTQNLVDKAHRALVADVAKGRGKSMAHIEAHFGRGDDDRRRSQISRRGGPYQHHTRDNGAPDEDVARPDDAGQPRAGRSRAGHLGKRRRRHEQRLRYARLLEAQR
jgi:hypothetical protein